MFRTMMAVSVPASAVMVMMVRVTEVCSAETVPPTSVVVSTVAGMVPMIAAPRSVVMSVKVASAVGPVALLILLTLG